MTDYIDITFVGDKASAIKTLNSEITNLQKLSPGTKNHAKHWKLTVTGYKSVATDENEQ